MSQKTETFSIGDTAIMTGIAQTRLRNWERAGLIPPPNKARCGDRAYRRYSGEDVNRIMGIKALLQQGYTLAHAARTIAAGEKGGQS